MRILSGLTQKDIAEKLNIKQNTYSQYESGKREPSIDVLIELANIFDTSIDYIVGLTEEEQPYPKN